MSETTVKIDELIDSSPISTLQWRVVILCFLLAMIDGIDAQSIAYVAPLVADEFALSPEVMGQLLAIAMVGLMFGALIGSPVSDRVGRKPVIIISAALMGVFSLCTAFADSIFELFLYRFLTGLGLGATMPSINILTAEFAPARRRALLMTLMFTGLPIGIIAGGLIAAVLIEQFGWESVFVVGGILPLVMVAVTSILLPESPRFLAFKRKNFSTLARIVNSINPGTGASANSLFETEIPKRDIGSIRALFAHGRAKVTLLLWLLFSTNLLTIYAVIAWLPSVLEAAGFPLERAILASVLFSVGGVVGGLMIAAAIDRLGAIKTMRTALLIAALAITLIGQVTASLPLLLITLFIAGATAMGSQFGLNAMASGSYDTGSRATGLGWSLAVGRLGAIFGPIAVGAAVGLDLPISRLFMLGSIPMLVAVASVVLLGKLKSG